MTIGLALSGGGIRATVFHLGVLARLAREGRFEQVTFISTASGGSLAIALVWATAGGSWPSSKEFLRDCVPNCRRLATTHDIQLEYVCRTTLTPWRLLHGRAGLVGTILEDRWNLRSSLADLPENPRWIINATCYETGKNWRFMRKRMGDYLTGYVLSPDLQISAAVAASAAFPGLIGPLSLRTDRYEWSRFDGKGMTVRHEVGFPTVHLWDGGVYDNLGVEALFKPSGGYRDGFDFLMVSDASSSLTLQHHRWRAPFHLLDIATDQVRSLRARTLLAHFRENPGVGAYVKIGKTSEDIYQEASGRRPAGHGSDSNELSPAHVRQVAGMKTTMRQLSDTEFGVLFHHGFEAGNATLSAYSPDTFAYVPYDS